MIPIGGNSTTQKFDQRRIELRDDYNLAPMDWMGTRNLQVGATLDFMQYHVDKSLFGNPQYNYRRDPANNLSFDQPFEAE